jgi:DNA-binding MarR family transcriptional regulator
VENNTAEDNTAETGTARWDAAEWDGARGQGRPQPHRASAEGGHAGGTVSDARPLRDSADDQYDRWLPVLPDLDQDMEGAVTRMYLLTRHLGRVKERTLARFDLQRHEYETLHALAGRGGEATPSELAADLKMAPASVTGRLEGLEQRGYLVRTPSTADRRRVDVVLTDAGRAAWHAAIDVVGDEERHLLAALDPAERKTLADLLRRITARVERGEDRVDPDEHP